ncbi:MAG TPA: SBBP repeat-containing protein, partial [Chitinophagales bacterium]|nr:SBBP repeat-containing protein [Chitinophagales bacterium]
MRKPLCFLTAVYCFSKGIKLRFLKKHQPTNWLISVFLILFGLMHSTYASAQVTEFKKLSDEDQRVKDILHQYDQKLFFTQNKGQWDNMVLYKVDFKFGQAIATQNGMLMGTYDPKSMSDIYEWADKGEENMHKGIPFNEEKPELKGHNWLMHFLQASPKMTIEAKEAHEDKFSYFMEREESKYAALSNNYQEIWYKNVYDKVDVRYYPSEEGHLEYDIICKPGFSKEQIAVQFDGIDNMEVDDKGNLVLKTSVQDVQLPAPYAYQVINGVKNKIEIYYTIEKNVLTFQIGVFDKSAPLIIDPIALRWASWLTNNSAGDNHGHGVWVDETDGAIYVLARIVGNGLITSVGAYQTSSAGNLDIVVGKYLEPSAVNQSGTRVWQTYLGGSSDDNPYAMEMGEDGNIYITGYTNSSNFPLLGGTAFNGTGASLDNRSQSASNIFVTKINKAGNSIKSAVIGGNGGGEQSYDLRTTKTDVLVCGQTNSTNLATLYPGSGATNSNAGGTDVLIFKINQNLTAISWMSNYGGSGDDRANIMLSNPINGDIFVAGQTASSNFPTLNARQTSRGGSQAGFLQKLSLSGVTAWRSYFSSASSASASILCMEFNMTKDKLYFGGLTTGLAAANISSSGVYDNSLNGGTDLFVCRMDTGQLFNMSTYLGGTSSEDNMMGLNTDANNDVYVFAYTPSTNFPVTADALQSSNQGQSDKTFSKLNANLNALLFSTYYGGTSEDYDPVGERGIKFANCRIYTLVTAQSNNIPLTQNALTTNKLSSTSIYEPGIVIWANPPDLLGNSITPNQQICLGATPANMTGSVPAYSVPTIVRNGITYTYPPITTPITYQWQISTDSINWTDISGATGQNLNGNMIGPVFQNTYIRRIISGDACVLSGASDQIISLKILALSGAVTPVTCAPDRNGAINLTVTNGTVPYSYLWNDGVITKDRSGLSAGTYSVTVTDAHGCSAVKSFDVVNSSTKPEIVATAVPPILCNGQSSILSFSPANDIQTVNWYNGCGTLGAFLGNANTVTVSPSINSQYSVIVQSTSGCKDTACVSVMIENTPPLITNVPSNLNVSCSSDVPQADISTITVTDNSSGNITVTVQDVISNQTCANRYTITRTWTA